MGTYCETKKKSHERMEQGLTAIAAAKPFQMFQNLLQLR